MLSADEGGAANDTPEFRALPGADPNPAPSAMPAPGSFGSNLFLTDISAGFEIWSVGAGKLHLAPTWLHYAGQRAASLRS
jgi:hypothetical protein